MSRPACAVLLAVGAVGAWGCGGEEKPVSSKDPFTAIQRDFDNPAPLRAAPHWETLASFSGTGNERRTVDVADGSIQWRVRWSCRKGSFRVAVQPPPSGPAVSEGPCPGRRKTEFIGKGRRTLEIAADGPWRMSVEQEVQTPLAEAPLPGMRGKGARVLAKGSFKRVERKSAGAAALHRLANGRLALRFEGFRTVANTDLFVWTSRDPKIRTTREALASKHRVIARLKATLGDENYLLPKGVKPDDVRSIVIWCEPVRIAYAAASLD